jgi:hypothetical protein
VAFNENVEHVQDGEAVKEGVAARPTRQLEENVKNLRDRFEDAALGKALYDYDVTLEPECDVGTPVYWNPEALRYERALAGAEAGADGVLRPLDSCFVAGIVRLKTADNRGDLLTLGRDQIEGVSRAFESQNAVPGAYYLSAKHPGKLVHRADRPAAGVPVLVLYDGDEVLVAPSVKDFALDHLHLRFELACRPAGTHVAPNDGERHVVLDGDASVPGWLPAGHNALGGNAPAGAAFGYNLAADTELAALWPPVPAEAAALLWDKDGDGAREAPLGQDGLVMIDAYGIWWMSDAYGDVPWPVDWSAPTSTSSISSAQPEQPRSRRMRAYVQFSRANYLTWPNVVTRLTPAADSPIQLVDRRGQAATTGDLTAVYQSADRYLPFVKTQLSGAAAEAAAFGVGYWALPQGQASTVFLKLRLPSAGLPAAPRLAVRLVLLGRTAGTLPKLTVAYRRLAAGSVTEAKALESDEQGLTLDTERAVAADRYVLVAADGFEVKAGETVLVSVRRDGADGYGGEVGLADVEGVLTGA